MKLIRHDKTRHIVLWDGPFYAPGRDSKLKFVAVVISFPESGSTGHASPSRRPSCDLICSVGSITCCLLQQLYCVYALSQEAGIRATKRHSLCFLNQSVSCYSELLQSLRVIDRKIHQNLYNLCLCQYGLIASYSNCRLDQLNRGLKYRGIVRFRSNEL